METDPQKREVPFQGQTGKDSEGVSELLCLRLGDGVGTAQVRAGARQVPSSMLISQKGKPSPEPRPVHCPQAALPPGLRLIQFGDEKVAGCSLLPCRPSSFLLGGALLSAHLSRCLPRAWAALQDLSFLLTSNS